MKKVKLYELEEGDLFIYEGRYYEVLDTSHQVAAPDYRDAGIKVKCFMTPRSYVDIGAELYLSIETEVLLCEQ